MKVIFLKDIPGTARKNDIKEVSDGYASNFLFPRKLAKIATPEAIQQAEVEKANTVAKMQEVRENVKEVVKKLEGISIKLTGKVSEAGHLYAAITEKDIIDKLVEVAKIELQKKNIKLDKHIKELGEHEVEIKLTDKESVKINVIIEESK